MHYTYIARHLWDVIPGCTKRSMSYKQHIANHDPLAFVWHPLRIQCMFGFIRCFNHSPFGLRFPDVREAMPLRRGHELIIEDLVPSEQKRMVPFILPHGFPMVIVPSTFTPVQYNQWIQKHRHEAGHEVHLCWCMVFLHAIQGFMHMLIFHKQM